MVRTKNFGLEKYFLPKKLLVQKNFSSKKKYFWSEKFVLVQKMFFVKRNVWSEKKFGYETNFEFRKMFFGRKFWVWKMCPKIFCVQQILCPKNMLGQIANRQMLPGHKLPRHWSPWLLASDCPRNLPWKFGQNQDSNICDISAWTNVTVTVGICPRCSQEPKFKVWSKSG